MEDDGREKQSDVDYWVRGSEEGEDGGELCGEVANNPV